MEGTPAFEFQDHSRARDTVMAPAGPINLFFVDITSLNDFDLVEFLTINNASHTVRAESRNGLLTAASKYSAKEESSQTLGLPYFVYRHERPFVSEGPAFRIVPIKKKYFETVKRVSKVYTKAELETRIEHVRIATLDGTLAKTDSMANMTTIHDAWPDLSVQMRQFLFKMAKREYANKIDVNVEKYNEKLNNAQNILVRITENEIVTAITHERLPLRAEFDLYKTSLITSQLNFLNRTQATANSSTQSNSVITTAPQNHEGTNRTLSWDNDYDDLPYDSELIPEPERLIIQEEDLNPMSVNRIASTPIQPRLQSSRNLSELPTPEIRRVAETETREVHVTNHRQNTRENLDQFIHDEVDNDGLRTPVMENETRNPGTIGEERSRRQPRNHHHDCTENEDEEDLINLSNDNLCNRGRAKPSVGFAEDANRGRQRATTRSQSPHRSAMRQSSSDRNPRDRSKDRRRSRSRDRSREPLRVMRDDRGYEFGARQINYSIYDDKDQDQTPTEFFRNFRVEVATNLKRGNIFQIGIPTIVALAKSCIKSKEKKKAFEREVKSREPRNINDVQKCFEEAMTISNQLRKTRFNAIKKKPAGENWVDFAQRYEKQFEIAYGIDSEGGANLVLMDRFQRCLSTQREMETLQMYLLMVDEKDQNIHSLCEKLEIVEANVTSKEAEKHPLYVLQSKDKTKNVNCRYCGRLGHIERECRTKMAAQNRNSNTQQQNQRGCKRCGRNNHQAHECFAKTPINQSFQKSQNNGNNNTLANRNNGQYQNNSRNQRFENQRFNQNQNNNNQRNGSFNNQRQNQRQSQFNNQNGSSSNNRSYNNNQYNSNKNWQSSNNNGRNQNRRNQNGQDGQRQNTQYQHNRFRRQ